MAAKLSIKDKLAQAIDDGLEEEAIKALAKGVDPNGRPTARTRLWLHIAVERNLPKLCEALLDRGANIEAEIEKKHRPIHLAVRHADAKLCELLVQRGADLNKKIWTRATPLFMAARSGLADVCGVLLSGKPKVDLQCESDMTALHAAAMGGHADICRMLLDHKADISMRSIGGDTPLFAAISSEISEKKRKSSGAIVDMLLAAGADPNAIGYRKNRPLHRAAHVGNEEIARSLLAAGANPNAVNENSEVPLDVAAEKGWPDVCAALLEWEANPFGGKMASESYPLSVAKRKGYLEIAGMLTAAIESRRMDMGIRNPVPEGLEDGDTRKKTGRGGREGGL